MSDDGPVPSQRGDEERLFERYDKRLRRATQLSVNTSPDIVDDACAFAWMKLLANQPRRETLFGWLKVVARNEALRLDGLVRGVASLGHAPADEGAVPEPAAVRGRLETVQGMLEVRERLAALPARQRDLVFLHAAGWRYQELAEREGISSTRVNQLLASASVRMREMDIREHEATAPRARQLRALEEEPPQYLVAAIGRPPSSNRKSGNEDLRREWKRLALSIDDFRTANGVTDPVRALGRDATVVGHRELARRVLSFRRERGLSRGLER